MDKDVTKLNKWVIIAILFILPPFGIVFLWFSKAFSNPMKSILTILFSIYFISILIMLGSA